MLLVRHALYNNSVPSFSKTTIWNYHIKSVLITTWAYNLQNGEKYRNPTFDEGERLRGERASGWKKKSGIVPICDWQTLGGFALTTAMTWKTSLQNKHMCRCDYFAIIPSWLHMLCWRSTLSLDWCARRWIKCREWKYLRSYIYI